MAFNYFNGALYVALRHITHPSAIYTRSLDKVTLHPQQISASCYWGEDFVRAQVTALTKPPSPLAPYSAIIYNFTNGLQEMFLRSSQETTAIAGDVLAMKQEAPVMVMLREKQLSLLARYRAVLDYCKNNRIGNSVASYMAIDRRYRQIFTLFDTTSPDITDKECDRIFDLADKAEKIRRSMLSLYSLPSID